MDHVFILNAKHVRTGMGGALPDGYLELASAIEVARSLANAGNDAQYKETETVDADPDFEVLFSAENGMFKYEVIRVRIAY